ncbi:MAG TPA: diphosphomevalonate decarboxylase [Bdellovibrionota bacterium]|jgi:diphosphomevalonate decarboxylase
MWKASAPSNIALIKYMGKESGGLNQAVNPSLSMTLADFRTSVEIEQVSEKDGADRWEQLSGSSPLRPEGAKRYVDFFSKMKKEQEVGGSFLIRSGNNFPSDAGLASSASSFAALTLAACTAFADLKKRPLPAPGQMAMISRTGSGSSCRSFFSPWCAWEGDKIGTVECKLPPLVDLVAVIDAGSKKISSSEAHKRVQTSPLFDGRPLRAGQRMQSLKKAMAEGNFQQVAEISWAELWDMHSLFHTSGTPFFYLSPLSIAVLRWNEERWEQKGKGPIATVDAGPNVHFLVPEPEKAMYRKELEAIAGVTVMESRA